jgi:hypothetical protein
MRCSSHLAPELSGSSEYLRARRLGISVEQEGRRWEIQLFSFVLMRAIRGNHEN